MSAMLLLLVIAGPLVGAAAALVGRDVRTAGRSMVTGAAVAAASAAGLIVAAGTAAGGRVGWPVDGGAWLGLGVSRPGAVLAFLVTGTTAVIATFCQRSFDDDGRGPRSMSLIGLVGAGSTLVVLQGSPALLVVGWLVSGWALVGLIGFVPAWAPATDARSRIWRTLAIGDVALVAAVLITGWAGDGLLSGQPGPAVQDLTDTSVGGVAALHVVAVLVVVAGASRSALLPFHRWLIGTLAAPTPVSALVHAGLVSGAGLVLLRFADVFVLSSPAVVLAFVLGIATVLVASSAMVMRSDAKGALAWSTVAQMAFMVIQCSVGAFSSAVFHIGGHGMYKAALFLGVGDTAAIGLRARRRASGHQPMPVAARLAVSTLAPTAAVAAAVALIPPAVSDGGRVLIVVFAWLSLAFALSGWLARGPMAPALAAVTGSGSAAVLAFIYIGGLRLFEDFMQPSLASIPADTAIGPAEVIIAIALVSAAAGLLAMPGPLGRSLRRSWRRLVVVLVEPGPPSASAAVTGQQAHPIAAAAAARADARDLVGLAEIRADGAKAAAIIAPQWPLASFVAVNPLDGIESLGFDAATDEARRWLGARTHLTLAQFRHDHRQGLSTVADLEHAAWRRFAEVCDGEPIEVDGRTIPPVEVIVADLLHGPEGDTTERVGTTLAARGPAAEPWLVLIDELLAGWLASYVKPPVWGGPEVGERFTTMCCRLLVDDPRLGALLDPSTRSAIADLPDDPADIVDLALEVAGVPADRRVDELRAQMCRLAGWVGLAKWRNEWAHPDEPLAPLAPLEVAAIRALLEAVVLGSGVVGTSAAAAEVLDAAVSDQAIGFEPATGSPDDGNGIDPSGPGDDEQLASRVGAVADALGQTTTRVDCEAIAAVLAQVPATARPSLWLAAQERRFERQLLALIDRPKHVTDRSEEGAARIEAAAVGDRPDAQAVFCIDVRSEGFRRYLEAEAAVQTLGFAGFFGVPMRLRRLGWDHSEARCPVLVAPAITATEYPRNDAIGQVSSAMATERVANAIDAAHASAKYGLGAAFTLAETVGWATGPHAAVRTLRPPRSSAPDVPPTRLFLDDDEILLEQRVFFAEGALRTMGLASGFAPLVLLCGHTSQTVNNPHGTALECGACAGASGGDNARAVAALLNAPDVRHGLIDRGIEIPDDTWFLAGLHDTASDQVALLDVDDAPATHREPIAALARAMAVAGQRQSEDRAAHLPGPAAAVRDRGADWAQVRPEWGLAGNAAFVIGPRSMTAGRDLDGRAFLHEYEAGADPTGRVLETIMTAPLVVGHWISSQYYFSTVDPERFGAGDKLVHNPIGTTGVVSGDRGDLRVGLPLQSTHVDGRRYHQPLRLMAVIQADPARIDEIIAANPILQSLTGGSWLRIAGRADQDEPWSIRTSDGAWITEPDPSTDRSSPLRTRS